MVTDTLQRAIGELTPDELAELREAIDYALDPTQTSTSLTAAQERMVTSREAEMAADPSIGLTREELNERIRVRWGA
jgi:putative addiction module component (TIGR02574 family)